ncbi:receptor-like kinase tmk4 [Fagus crenata]
MGHQRTLLYLYTFISLLTLSSFTAADDTAAMSKLLAALSPTPSEWSATTACCNWKNVNCDSTGRVTSIKLVSQGLSGTLPSDLNTLTQLTSLSLQSNSLSGPIPSLANLSSLQQLYLDNNNFTSIPNGFFQGLTSLQILTLTQNIDLAPWYIPTELTQATSLVTFYASNANIIGSLPDIFDKLPSLQDLRLSYNNLTGPLPKSFGGSGIKNLWLDYQLNGLSGNINVLSSMTQLNQAWLHKNQFTGPIPDLSNCTSLFDLQLRDNQFTGLIPASLMSILSLKNVSLDNNELQGPYPKFPSGTKVTLDGINSFCLTAPGLACDPQVTALLEIAAALEYPINLATSWTGNNACNQWTSVICDSQGTIITVNFGKLGFVGTISPAFTKLTSFRNLYLNDNSLTGSIPAGLANMTSLQLLDVSNNNLTGLIPNFASTVKLVKSGNPLLGINTPSGSGGSGGSSPSNGTTNNGSSAGTGSSSSSVSPGTIAGIVIAVVVFVVLFIWIICYLRKRHSRFGSVKNGKEVIMNIGGSNVVISIEVLRQATNNFSEDNILGRGGFGVVYKGELYDGTKIAVKRMKSVAMSCRGMKQFDAEIAVLTKVRHRHLVALLGYCINENERLLVFEYVPEGTLTQHLFQWTTGRVTTKVDVYAFGVILMELITSRKALDDTMPDEGSQLVPWFRQILINKENIPNAIDQTLNPDEETMESIYKVVELAGYCTTRESYKRPDMGHVVNILSPLVEQWNPISHEEEHTHSIFHGEEDTYGIDPHISLSLTLER